MSADNQSQSEERGQSGPRLLPLVSGTLAPTRHKQPITVTNQSKHDFVGNLSQTTRIVSDSSSRTCIYYLSSLSFPSFIKDSILIVGDSDLLLSRKGTGLLASGISSLGLVEFETSDPSVLRKSKELKNLMPK